MHSCHMGENDDLIRVVRAEGTRICGEETEDTVHGMGLDGVGHCRLCCKI